jgi:hypothetical protein
VDSESRVGRNVSSAEAAARDAADSPAVDRLARVGWAAKGALYGLIGLLAIQIPAGLGGKTTDQQGALRTVADETGGTLLLVLLALGFAAYAAWRAVEAATGRGAGTGAEGAGKRLGAAVSGAIHLGLAGAAIALVIGAGSGSSGPDSVTARVMDLPLGVWLVGAVGVGVVGVGAYNAWEGVSRKFEECLRIGEMGPRERSVARVVGIAGLVARGVVFALIGAFLVKAAVEFDPKDAIGLDGALAKVANQTYGRWLLALAALGLLCYAAFCAVQARYRRI